METSFSQRDRQVLWHPFTQVKIDSPPIPIVRGKGALLYAEDGTAYLDAISSWWVNLHGHCHPYICAKINRQLKTLEHTMFADITHPPAIELAERLLKILPGGMSKVFFSDNGSTAVETALKMVFQYWHNQDPKTKKQTIIAFEGGYHGDTFGAMSLAGKHAFNQAFWPHLFKIASIPPPLEGQEDRSVQHLRKLISSNTIAGFIFEPIVQGVRGMVRHSAKGLSALIGLCRRHGILTIADEVMTGFGRLGPLFASSLTANSADIICLAKGLTGGFLPLAATVVREEVFNGFISPQRNKALLHGHTYTANPLACIAAIASLDLLETETCSRQRIRIENQHMEFCRQWGSHPNLKRCEAIGTILALEYKTAEEGSYFNTLRKHLSSYFLREKILLRPFGNTLHMMPPYCIHNSQLQQIYQKIAVTLEHN